MEICGIIGAMKKPYLVIVQDGPDKIPVMGSCSTCHKVFSPTTSTNRDEVILELTEMFFEHSNWIHVREHDSQAAARILKNPQTSSGWGGLSL